MASCYSGDHITENHIHTDITLCNIEEQQWKFHLGADSNRLLGMGSGGSGGGLKHALLDPNPRHKLLQSLETFDPHETDQ